ncbi:MAG: hypothetical protein HZA34_03725 [Candidatus Pacebacteria bacterium]|nr:hypothetical protein [Candidatus Paceibacterota bacterium]
MTTNTEPQIVVTHTQDINTFLNSLLSPKTTEDKLYAQSAVFLGASSIGIAATISAELSRMVIGGSLFPQLTELFHSLIQHERSFYLLVYSGSDFAVVFTGTLGFAAMTNLLKGVMIERIHEKFIALKKTQENKETIVLLEKLEVGLTFAIEGVEFTAVSFLGAINTSMWLLDELAQLTVGVYYADRKQTGQIEDLYAYLYGFALAMAIYTAFKIRAYISYYSAKDTEKEEE